MPIAPPRVLERTDIPAAVDVLWDSFHAYPVMRYIIGETPHYDEYLRHSVEYLVEARFHRGELSLGTEVDGVLRGVALVAYPEAPPSETLVPLREALWERLGPGAAERWSYFGENVAPLREEVPHIHLNMIGVHASARGTGIGRVLLEAVHAHSVARPGSTGVSLTTEVEPNVALYQHFGYEVHGHVKIAEEVPSWTMFRPDPAGG